MDTHEILDSSMIRDGGKLLEGSYSAELSVFLEEGEKKIVFPPIHVNEKSPQELVYRLNTAPVKYSGQVLNALTGEGMSGVPVVLKLGRGKKLQGSLSKNDWAAIKQNSGMTESPLGEIVQFLDVTYTDSAGLYSINADERGQIFVSLMALDAGFISTSRVIGRTESKKWIKKTLKWTLFI